MEEEGNVVNDVNVAMVLDYHIGGIFEILILSCIGFFLPFLLIKYSNISIENISENLSFRCLKSFSSGIILSVAFLHLLAESIESLSEYAEYPVALAMCLGGFMVTLALEQLAMHVMLTLSIDDIKSDDHKLNIHNSESSYGNQDSSELPELQVQSSELGQHIHEHVHSKQMVADKDLRKSFIKAIVFEGAVVCHSIIVGFGVGATTDIPTLKVLLVAIGLHQFFEGIGLGTALFEGKISMRYVYLFGSLFSLTASIGVILGMYSTTDNEEGTIVTGFADSFAAGILIYSSIVEVIAEDYMDSSIKSIYAKMLMYFSLSLGIAVMAVLAIWA